MESCPVIKGYYLVIGGGKIDFLIAASTVFSCTEAARCHSYLVNAPSHDCFTRLLQNQSPDTESLWSEILIKSFPQTGITQS